MIVHRFMSEAEYECLIAGGKLMNATDHHRERGKKSNSRGFCFFPEDPEDAIHWLFGIVRTDWCVTLDIPDNLLRESRGIYRDVDNAPYDPNEDTWIEMFLMPIPKIERKEYCLTEYSLQTVHILAATDKYARYGQED